MAKQTDFDKLVAEGQQALSDIHRNVHGDGKLSTAASVAKAAKNAGMTLQQVKELSARLESLDLGEFIQDYMTKLSGLIIGVKVYMDTINTIGEPPTSNFGAIFGYAGQGAKTAWVGFLTESLSIGSNPLQITAVTYYRVSMTHPKALAFGNCSDLDVFHAAVKKQQQQFDDLCKRIETSWSVSDVLIEEVSRNSDTAFIKFKLGNGVVSALPREGSGIRLLEYLRARSAKAA